MGEPPAVRWGVGGVAALLMIAAVVSGWQSRPGDALTVPPALLSRLGATPSDESSEILTEIQDHLARRHPVRQVLLLQAVSDEPAQVVAAPQDSSDEEPATHWPSPWKAVNLALSLGRIEEPTTVHGHHAGFDYRHDMLPVDESRSRILLINQAMPAPGWLNQRGLFVAIALMLWAALWFTRGQ